ncbi:hypothetical protein HPB49_013270 [Dermacentor silvarum]|uniref:Uncharacterized protein n=1 Tax=Dermacentor silvarum TaxID=543639 RepID=A0ACB8DIU2_DERSI|nr:hypothetical protein HPB49_013270 [Dermacentor silvarum]
MAPPGRTGNSPQTTPTPEADTYTGYDPHGMLWTTIQTSDSRPELPQTFQSTALAAAVARRERASGAAIAAADAAAQTCSTTLPPPATRSAGPQLRKKKPTWQPLPLPKPKTTDFVVVLKPRTEPAARSSPTLEQTPTGWSHRTGAPFGYLRADTQDACYGVVTVRSTDSEAELQKHLYWPEGEILHIRRLGTTNKVRLTFSGKVKPRYVTYDALLILVHPYKKTIPACSQCGSVGHRPDACPGPKPDLCGTCGNTVPLMDGARAPHECTPKCAICAGPHVTGDRSCKERYRAPPPKSPTPPLEIQPDPTKGKRQRPRKPRPPDTRA